MLTVKNGNDFDFTGRFNGVDYQFPKGAIVALPEDAARHIFGVGLADKSEILVRHGWMKTANDEAKAMGNLNGFSFNVAETLEAGEVVEDTGSPDEEQGTAPLQGSGGGMDSDGSIPPANPSRNRGSILEQLGG